MITRSKKSKTSVNANPQTSKEEANFDVIPVDLVREVMGRLPAKSVARFLLVSKLWEKIIRSRDFITSFPFRSCSSSQPRLLIAFGGLDSPEGRFGRHDARRWDPRMQNWNFFSSTLSSSNFLSRSNVTCPLPNPEEIEYHSHYVNGLLSFGYGQQQFIVNPTTGKSIALPRVKTRRRFAKSFFGYDPVNDEYKVLCMTEKLHGLPKKPSSQHQIYNLGGDIEKQKQKAWRLIECSLPHRPCSNGVCIDGVVYYLSKTGNDLSQVSLMSFDLRSEKFGLVTGVPANTGIVVYTSWKTLFVLTYEGKVAIPIQASYAYEFDVWIMDPNDEKHEWTLMKISLGIETWKILFQYNQMIRIRGITQTGEFILTPTSYKSDDVYVVYYNPNTDTLRKIKVE
ncbi:hypothetical protein EUTSA_v10015249mg, partial [Eutrema salsugineum]